MKREDIAFGIWRDRKIEINTLRKSKYINKIKVVNYIKNELKGKKDES